MEKERFVAADTGTWWLLERDVDHLIENLRIDLGASFGWTDPTWYHERAKLEEVYDFIQQHRSELFHELDQATDDEKRQRWLGSVVELKRPADSASGEPARSAAATATPKTSAQPARRSAFASKSQPETQTPAADTGTAAQTAASTSAQPARRSAFASKSQPETQTPAADTGTAAQAEEQVGQIAEQIKEVMSDLSPDDLSAIATDLGLSPEEVEAMVQEPDFARMVAEEQP
jgi:hypothetical protein